MKISSRTIIKTLRLYGIADINASPKALRKLEITEYDAFVRATFVFDDTRYGLLFGSVVDEDELETLWPNRQDGLELLPNPLDPSNHTTPYQGKYLVLLRLEPTKQRLDIYLTNNFDDTNSRSQWQKYIKMGCVSINGIVVNSPRTEVDDTDIIKVAYPKVAASPHDPKIIYQDEDVVVINKPSGMLSHAKGGVLKEATVADFLAPYMTDDSDGERAGIVHRLDRDTSGILIGARHKRALAHLQKEFADRRVSKIYLAVVEGRPKIDAAIIDLPISRHPTRPSTFRVDSKGKEAQTSYQVLASNSSLSLVRLAPRTGRTHQLRVHLAHLGTPIVGDRVYGKAGERLLLHAHQLEIKLPSGESRLFEAPVPEELIEEFPGVSL